ncbi:MAG: DUF72 domain-containing protein [Candidatus Binatia bacterium]
MRQKGTARIGTSGYHYNHWRGVFYPDELPKARWFSYYARHFDRVEINNTFYHLPTATAFDSWKKEAPAGFCYAVKFNRYGSHFMRLKEPDATLGNFLAVAKRLKQTLGPILVQLPPRWSANAQRLDEFLEAAPRRLRFAVEFRDERWLCPQVFRVLERHRAALCIHDMLKNHPRLVTADWTYLRYHGNHYSGSYSEQHLASEAEWINRQLAAGLDVFAYFNNDAHGDAVQNAATLKTFVAGRQPTAKRSRA